MEWTVEGLSYSITYAPGAAEHLKVTGKGKVTGCSIDQPWLFEPITELYLEEGITEIGKAAFANMLELQIVYLPATLKRICAGAFSGCPNLVEIRYMGELSKLEKIKIAADAMPHWYYGSAPKKKGKGKK